MKNIGECSIESDTLFVKNSFSKIYSHNYIKIKINLNDNLLLEKILNMNNAVILFKSAFNEYYNHSDYQVYLEKCSCKMAERML